MCVEDGCGNAAKTRGLCRKHYMQHRSRGTLSEDLHPRATRAGAHSLTSIDREGKRAICSICGPVKVRVRDRGSARGGVECGNRVSEYRARHKLRYPERYKEWDRARDRDRRAQSLWKKYRLTLEDFDRMAHDQGGACAICGEVPAGNLHVDHDHKTGEVRGLLCMGCNVAIGHMRENRDALQKAAAYLKPQA